MPKTQKPTALSPARLQLQEVLEAKQRAMTLVDKAQKVVDAATEAVERARDEVSRYAEIDEDAVKARLAVLKGEPGAKGPEEIREARRNRALAKEELLSADETLQVAQQELVEAHGNVARATKMCASHATGVIAESATDAIAEWEKLSEERETLRTILDSLITVKVPMNNLSPQQRSDLFQGAVSQAGLPFGDYLDWRRLQEKIGPQLARNFSQPDPGPGIARARAYWAAFADSILADPAAEQEPLPSLLDLFG